LRQILFFELQAHRVVLHVGELCQPVSQIESEEDGGVQAEGDTGITLLDLREGGPADRGALEAWLAAQPLSIDETLDLAKRARADNNLWLAEHLLRTVFDDRPHHRGVVVRLSGVLRDQGQPEEALRITAPFVSSSYAPIFTTRAAALCDLGRWEEARHEVRRALAISRDDEALAVVDRIKKAWTDLYA
jgi:tetratricopeptide (TPR) repeat protein